MLADDESSKDYTEVLTNMDQGIPILTSSSCVDIDVDQIAKHYQQEENGVVYGAFKPDFTSKETFDSYWEGMVISILTL